MKEFKLYICLLIAFCGLSTLHAQEQERTVGIMQNSSEAFEGYTLFSCIYRSGVYLVDNCGKKVHEWGDDVRLANAAYLQEDGSLIRNYNTPDADPTIRIGGGGEGIQKLDWDGNILWDFKYNTATYRVHHDIAILPNGNILSLVFEERDFDACMQAGRDLDLLVDNKLWPEKIIEIEPSGTDGGEIVWEWVIWDHLIQDYDSTKDNYGVVADHPELLDINFVNTDINNPGEADWLHFNAIDYNPVLDQIIVSSQRLSEIYIIDHGTTTEEAASHSGGRYGQGGDFLWRWGNPQVYDQGTIDDKKLWSQHDAHWIPAGRQDGGKIMVFNNGDHRIPFHYSSVDIIVPPINPIGDYAITPGTAFGPVDPEWTYTSDLKTDFYSGFISSAKRLPNGNTLVCEGADGRIFELNWNKDIVWEYVNPMYSDGTLEQGQEIPWNGWTHMNATFRAKRYAADFIGFAGRDLSPKGTVERNPWEDSCVVPVKFPISMVVYPTVTNEFLNVDFQNIFGNDGRMRIFDDQGKLVYSSDTPQPVNTVEVSDWRPGMYILRVGDRLFRRFIVVD